MVAMMGWALADQQGWRKGPWTPEEDKLLGESVKLHGEGRWSSVARASGLNRSGKSCRLRWVNYLRPGLKKGQITPQEEGIIIELHALWGNKWSTIARYLPGRTDNEIKNYWRTHFKKKERASQRQAKKRAQIMQQKWQQDHQQQQQQLGMMINNNEIKMANEGTNTEIYHHQNILTMCNSPNLEDQFQCMTSIIPQYEDSVITANNDFNNHNWAQDTGLWAGLWDLDDWGIHNVGHGSSVDKLATMQNQALAGASFNDLYGGGGYIY